MEATLENEISSLKQELGEERLINLQYQLTIKNAISKNRKLVEENDMIRNENKELTNQINRYQKIDNNSRSRQSTNRSDYQSSNGFSRRNELNNLTTDEWIAKLNDKDELIVSLREQIEELTNLRKKVERLDKGWREYRTSYIELKKEHDNLIKEFDKVGNKRIEELMNDPRINNTINKDSERKIKELTEENEKLQARLHEDQNKLGFDLNFVKKENQF